MASIEQMRHFAGVDPEAEEQVLLMCLMAAQEWYRHAGVPPKEKDDLYDFWVCNLAAWMYDSRGASGKDADIPAFIVSSVHQLRVPPRAETQAGDAG